MLGAQFFASLVKRQVHRAHPHLSLNRQHDKKQATQACVVNNI